MNATNETYLCQWTANGLVYKLYEIPREEIDEGSDEEFPAHNLIGLDSGNVRRFDETFDRAYDRVTLAQRNTVAEVFESAIPEAREILLQYAATYWQAETYRRGELKSIDFPRRASAEEALADVRGIPEGDETGAAVEWIDNDGKCINTGRMIEA